MWFETQHVTILVDGNQKSCSVWFHTQKEEKGENDLVDPGHKTLAEQARCEQSLMSKLHSTFKVCN